jgi:uncharacterized damage-inducible protein DinB
MADEYTSTDAFRGATFRRADLTGATFRDSDLTGVRIVACEVTGLRVSGFAGDAGGVIVDDVDVSGFVQSELDKRHPERAELRQARTADDFRVMWDTVERLWDETLVRADRLPEAVRHERVEEEWSLVETLRHLVFAIDVWIGRMIRGEELPFHPGGLPPTDYPDAGAAELGIDLAARPSYDEAAAMHAERRAQVRRVVEAVTDVELDEIRTAVPAPAWGEEAHSVRECLRVVMDEHCEHRRFAVRDLAVLEGVQGRQAVNPARG